MQREDLNLDGFSLNQLAALREDLEKTIQNKQETRKREALTRIDRIAQEAGLTKTDISKHLARNQRKRVAPKYRDPQTGDSWSGRGRRPNWIERKLQTGVALDDLRIQTPETRKADAVRKPQPTTPERLSAARDR
ncbi:MAG: H-NS histone family protein [Thermoanaerobaculia bacterium]|nr:H-NS histone family protein [Thermoanaerobaculia bacterium]